MFDLVRILLFDSASTIVGKLPSVWDWYSLIYDSLMRTPVFQQLGKLALGALPRCPGGLVHDGGTGTGFWLKDLLDITQARKVIATDISEKMLAKAEAKVKKLGKEYWSKVDLQRLDLTKEWPKGDFSLQFFQLLPNYLPNHGWRQLLESAAETTLPNGTICSSTLLEGLNVRELAREHILEQMRMTPLPSYPAMIFSAVIMSVWDKLSKSGRVVPPSKKEYIEYHRQVGFEDVEEIGEIFWGGGIVAKATLKARVEKMAQLEKGALAH